MRQILDRTIALVSRLPIATHPLSLARDPTLRLRDIAGVVGVTERATATLVSELVHAGYLRRFKDGRRNRYQVDLSGGLRHPVVGGVSVSEVFGPLLSRANGDQPSDRSAQAN